MIAYCQSIRTIGRIALQHVSNEVSKDQRREFIPGASLISKISMMVSYDGKNIFIVMETPFGFDLNHIIRGAVPLIPVISESWERFDHPGGSFTEYTA